MYQVKIFTASSPSEVEEQANDWLRRHSERHDIRQVRATATDVVQLTPNSGIQRFTLVLVCEYQDL